MIGLKIGPVDGVAFFNTEAVMARLGEAERIRLMRAGALVRKLAQQSIRPAVIINRKERRAAKKAGLKEPKPQYRASNPGEPPRSRRGDLKKFIFFGYEDASGPNVVIGPALLGGRASDVPHRLEFGGQFRERGGRIVTVKKRPFMRPAFDKAVKIMPALFRDSF